MGNWLGSQPGDKAALAWALRGGQLPVCRRPAEEGTQRKMMDMRAPRAERVEGTTDMWVPPRF
jgi:hypothetical protein